MFNSFHNELAGKKMIKKLLLETQSRPYRGVEAFAKFKNSCKNRFARSV